MYLTEVTSQSEIHRFYNAINYTCIWLKSLAKVKVIIFTMQLIIFGWNHYPRVLFVFISCNRLNLKSLVRSDIHFDICSLLNLSENRFKHEFLSERMAKVFLQDIGTIHLGTIVLMKQLRCFWGVQRFVEVCRDEILSWLLYEGHVLSPVKNWNQF
jgi:hypothetical protein